MGETTPDSESTDPDTPPVSFPNDEGLIVAIDDTDAVHVGAEDPEVLKAALDGVFDVHRALNRPDRDESTEDQREDLANLNEVLAEAYKRRAAGDLFTFRLLPEDFHVVVGAIAVSVDDTRYPEARMETAFHEWREATRAVHSDLRAVDPAPQSETMRAVADRLEARLADEE